MSTADMRLAGICRDCMHRLGIDQRLTMPLQYVKLSQLPKYDAKAMAGIQFPAASLGPGGPHGTTKITYKIAKTVKESIDDAASHTSHPGHSKSGRS